jgi:hypothetical protein
LEPSDIIIEAPELHGGGVDDAMKAAGGSLPEGEGCLCGIREPPGTSTPADQNSRQAARLDQDEKQKAGCKGKKEGCKAQGERNQSRSLANRAQAQQTQDQTSGPARKQTRSEVGLKTPREGIGAKLKTLVGGIDKALKGQQTEYQDKLQDL